MRDCRRSRLGRWTYGVESVESVDVPLPQMVGFFLLGAGPVLVAMTVVIRRTRRRSGHRAFTKLLAVALALSGLLLWRALPLLATSMTGGVSVRDRLTFAVALGVSCTLSVSALTAYVSSCTGRRPGSDGRRSNPTDRTDAAGDSDRREE